MIYEVEYNAARERAVAFIGLDRAKSSGRVAEVLRREGYASTVISAVIKYLQEIEYLNDKRAAAKISRRYQGRKLRSRRAMEQLYYQQGIEPGLCKSIAQELPPDLATATELVAALADDKIFSDHRKMYALLLRRGYDHEIAQKVLSLSRSGNVESVL